MNYISVVSSSSSRNVSFEFIQQNFAHSHIDILHGILAFTHPQRLVFHPPLQLQDITFIIDSGIPLF